jgi:Transposase DDE domain
MFDTDFLSNWPTELRNMNKGKKGAKYHYPNSFIFLLATIHVYLLPYRQMEGFLKVMSENIPRLKNQVPDYTTMWWRIVSKDKSRSKSYNNNNKSKRKRSKNNSS